MKTADIQVTLIDSMGSDLSVVNAARVSFEKESEFVATTPDGIERKNGCVYEKPECIKDGSISLAAWNAGTTLGLSKADKKLISYLAKHKHTSPFNHCFVTFRVKAPIFVARQLVKHKFMPWNEVSRRYVDSEPEFYFPEKFRAKAENVKQGSSTEGIKDQMQAGQCYEKLTEFALITYNNLLDAGVCAEQARSVLPLNTMTEWIWSGSLGAIADMCVLRLDSHSQYESRIVAKKISDEMSKLYPVSWAALMGDVLYGT